MSQEIVNLLNLGRVSAEWLAVVGITTVSELKSVGAEEAYRRVKEAGLKPTRNLLYALKGALEGIPWQEVAQREKKQ